MQPFRVTVIVKPYHVQIYAHGSHYTCPIKQVDNEWLFKFKGEWHKVDDYVDEHTIITNI